MESHGLANLLFDFCHGRASCDTARKVWDVRREIAISLFNDNCITHDHYPFLPACLRILPSVPGAKSSLGLPGTVTQPGFDGCLNCR